MTRLTAAGARAGALYALCFGAMAVDGVGVQLGGVTAPVIKTTFALSTNELGMFFSVVTVGLAIGAVIGGRLSDRIGRKPVLLASLALYGLSALLAALSQDFAVLLALRFLGGICLGGSLPNVVAVAAEASPPGRSHSAVTISYAGAPAGASLIALAAAVAGGWRLPFILSGVASILIVPLMARLPIGRPAACTASIAEPLSAGGRGLFSGAGATARTLALWIAFCGSSLILYLFISWLPLLFVAKGLSRAEANLVEVSFTAVGAISLFVGRAMEAFDQRIVCSVTFAVLLGATLLLARATSTSGLAVIFAEVGLLGIGINAVQAITYSIAPTIYQAQIRATGVGMGIAAARLGGIAGPLLAAALLAFGSGTAGVFLGVVPITVISYVCIIFLTPGTRQPVKVSAGP